MTTSKSYFQQLLHSRQDQIKRLSVKIVVALPFICSIIKIFHLKY